MRRAQSFPCPFDGCAVTSEKRRTAQAHIRAQHFPKPAKPKGITFRARVGVDVGRRDLVLRARKPVNLDDGNYTVNIVR